MVNMMWVLHMGNKKKKFRKKDVVFHLRASSTDLSWSYTSRACLLALVVICRKVNYSITQLLYSTYWYEKKCILFRFEFALPRSFFHQKSYCDANLTTFGYSNTCLRANIFAIGIFEIFRNITVFGHFSAKYATSKAPLLLL